MIRERLAGRPLARERRHGGGRVPGFGRGDFGGKFVLGCCALQFLQRRRRPVSTTSNRLV